MKRIILLLVIALVTHFVGFGQDEPVAVKVAPDLYEVALMGCNSAFFVTDSGVVVIDAGMTPIEGRQLQAAIRSVTNKPVSHLIITHFHFDHVGGIQIFPANVRIIAHSNFISDQARDGGMMLNNFIDEMEAEYKNLEESMGAAAEKLMEAGKKEKADSIMEPLKAYREFIDSSKVVKPCTPEVTFAQTLKFTTGGKEIILFNFGAGHTDADVVVYFPSANAVHVGDLCFGQSFPFIDAPSGGSINGWIKILGKIASNKSYKIILSGHGITGDKTVLTDMQQLLIELRKEVQAAIKNGLNIDETVAAVKMEKYQNYPGKDLLIKDIKVVYQELISKKK